MSGLNEYLQICRIVKFKYGYDEDDCNSSGDSDSGNYSQLDAKLRSREEILNNPYKVTYRCGTCRMNFPRSLECIYHYWQTHACYKCPDLPFSLNSMVIRTHKLQNHKCSYNGISFVEEDLSRDELRLSCNLECERTRAEIAEDLRPFIDYFCNHCRSVFRNLSELRVHIYRNHYCLRCSTYNQCVEFAKLHQETFHGSTYRCSRCHEVCIFANHEALVTHYLLKHYAEEDIIMLMPSGGILCDSDQHPALLQHHINRHARVHACILEDTRRTSYGVESQSKSSLGLTPCMYHFRALFIPLSKVPQPNAVKSDRGGLAGEFDSAS